MTKKILYTLLVVLGIAAIIALLWWWFSRPQTGSSANLGSATGAGSSQSTNSSGQTNIGLPIINTSAPAGKNIAIGSSGSVGGGSGAAQATNIPTSVVPAGGYSTAANSNYAQALYGNGTGSYSAGGGSSGSVVTPSGNLGTPGVSWFSGSQSNSDGSQTQTANSSTQAPGTVFNPIGINQLVTPDYLGSGGSIPDFGSGSYGQQGSGGLGIVGTALAAGAAGALACGAVEGFTWLMGGTSATAAASTAAGAGAGAVGAAISASAAASLPVAAISVMTINSSVAAGVAAGNAVINTQKATQDALAQGSQHASDTTINTFMSCIARTVAKIALQQITNSVVNWINSGFNGTPSFVQNPTQFFTNVADQAAGEFIKGSALSFLCSPFQLKIKIAIANSYANRNAQSCSLSQVIGNINSFMNGNFNSGGWPGMLSFTTVPTNNPYGAFMYADVGLTYAVQTAKGTQQRQLSLANGFLDFKTAAPGGCTVTTTPPPATPDRSVKLVSSDPEGSSYRVCNLITTTPGTVIQNALVGTENSSLQQLGLARDFDQIISALITQLMTRTLQGLSSMSGQSGYASNFQTPDQQQAQAAAQTLLSEMQADTGYAQQFGGTEQSSITDIQSAQQQLNTLYNCWTTASVSSTTQARQSTASTNALTASSTLQSLQPLVDALNGKITQANSAITLLQSMQSDALSALSTADIDTVTTAYKTALANGQIYTQTDVTGAQQDRTTLQSQLTGLNQQTAASLTQCYAF